MTFGLLAPNLKGDRVDNRLGNLFIVKGENRFVIDENVLAPCLVLDVLDIANQAFVVLEKRCPTIEISAHQGASNK